MAIRSIKLLKQQADGACTQVAVFEGTPVELLGTVTESEAGISVHNAAAHTYNKAVADIVDQYSNTQFVRSLAYVVPHGDGRIFVTGDACTQLVPYFGQGEDQDLVQASATGLVILDQCPACNDCSTKWSILQRIQTLQIILAGFKDNQLYTAQLAKKTWALMSQMRITSTDAVGTCQQAPDMTQRDAYVLPARRLFIQYKALVQMWNYLVYRGNSRVRIKHASGHPQGITIAIQHRTTQCYTQHYKLKLMLVATIVHGQVADSQGKLPKGISLVKDRLAVYAAQPQATYTSDADGTVQAPLSGPVITNTSQLGEGQADRIEIECQFDKLTQTGVCGLSVTLLPFQQQFSYSEDTKLCTLYRYQTNIANTTQIILGAPYNVSAAQMPEFNTWQVSAHWQLVDADGALIQDYGTQTKVYKTPLCPVARVSHSHSASAQVMQDNAGNFYITDSDGTRTTVYPVLGNNDIFVDADGRGFKNTL